MEVKVWPFLHIWEEMGPPPQTCVPRTTETRTKTAPIPRSTVPGTRAVPYLHKCDNEKCPFTLARNIGTATTAASAEDYSEGINVTECEGRHKAALVEPCTAVHHAKDPPLHSLDPRHLPGDSPGHSEPAPPGTQGVSVMKLDAPGVGEEQEKS